jgi:hypothetical protein
MYGLRSSDPIEVSDVNEMALKIPVIWNFEQCLHAISRWILKNLAIYVYFKEMVNPLKQNGYHMYRLLKH